MKNDSSGLNLWEVEFETSIDIGIGERQWQTIKGHVATGGNSIDDVQDSLMQPRTQNRMVLIKTAKYLGTLL